MAAWLAYLKSRLLLPEAHAPEGQSAEDMATALALRLKRLEAIRDGRRAADRPRRSSTATCSGAAIPEPIADIKHPEWTATLYDLLSAYAQQRQQHALGACAARQAHGLVAGRGARGARAADRRSRPTGRGSTNI